MISCNNQSNKKLLKEMMEKGFDIITPNAVKWDMLDSFDHMKNYIFIAYLGGSHPQRIIEDKKCWGQRYKWWKWRESDIIPDRYVNLNGATANIDNWAVGTMLYDNLNELHAIQKKNKEEKK